MSVAKVKPLFKISSNSEAITSELIENLEEICLITVVNSFVILWIISV